jgi:hypothetical protein
VADRGVRDGASDVRPLGQGGLIADLVGPVVDRVSRELTSLWSVRVPRLLDPFAPGLADALADGAWTAPWRGVSGFLPPAALALGILVALIRPGMPQVYTESLPFMILTIVGAILSGAFGLLLLIGYVVGDVLRGNSGYPFYGPLPIVGSQVIKYLLLAIPALHTPQLGRSLAKSVAVILPKGLGNWIGTRVTLYALACGMMTYLWSWGMVVLVRPVFTWQGQTPSTEAVAQVQHVWGVLVLCAVAAAVARVCLEEAVVPRVSRGSLIVELRRQRGLGQVRRGALWRRLPAPLRKWLRPVVTVTVTTLVLAGAYESWFDWLIVAGVTTLLEAWRARLTGSFSARLARVVQRLPALLRFAAIPLAGYVLAKLVIEQFAAVPIIGDFLANRIVPLLWGGDSLRPVAIGALLTLATSYLLFPGRRVQRPATRVPTTRLTPG